MKARHKAAADFLRKERGVDAPQVPEPEPQPEVQPERPADEPKPNQNPVQKEKPMPDMIAAAKAEREQAARDRVEAERIRKETEEQLNSAKDDPIGWLAKLGMTEDDWKKFNASGGIPPQVAKALREQQEYRAQSEKRIAEMEQRTRRAEEDRDIGSILNQFPLVRKCGGADAARAHAQALQAQGTPASTWSEVLSSFEEQLRTGLSNIFDDEEINGKYRFKQHSQPQHQAPAATSPTTLGSNHTSAGSYLDANAKNPYPYGSKANLDWKNKRAAAAFKGAIK